MAKNIRLIPDESSNWEVAVFLLIDYCFKPNPSLPSLKYSRTDIHSSIKSLNFIEKLLGSIGYEVKKTLSNSISSAITSLEKNGYIICDDGQCILTEKGFSRLQEIKTKYDEKKKVPIGKTKEMIKALQNCSIDEVERLLQKNKPL